MTSTFRDDKVLMATLALRGMRFKRLAPDGSYHQWLRHGWYWKMPETQWVGRFTTRREMLEDARQWFERKDGGDPVSITRVPATAQYVIEEA